MSEFAARQSLFRHSPLAISLFALAGARGEPLALERILRIDHGHYRHLRLGLHRRRIMVGGVENELAGQLHVELAFAGEPPRQLIARETALDRPADRIDRAGDRRECSAEVAGLL